MKTLVCYTFDAINSNFIYFVEHGLFDSSDITFIFICDHTVINYPVIPDYVTLLVRRYGSNYFSSWLQGLESVEISNYDHFIFLTGSVIGPFTPSYYSLPWTNIFTSGINDQVKLFGVHISVIFRPILSADIFCCDREALQILLGEPIFSPSDDSFSLREERMTSTLLKNNYNIGSLLRIQKDIDFRVANSYSHIGNIMESDKLDKLRILPYELVFITTNKKMHHMYYTPFLVRKRSIIFESEATIIKAKYGAKDKYVDVSLIIKNSILNNQPIIVSNEYFGCDPAYMIVKHLIVYYLKQNNYKKIVFEEKERIF